MLSAKWRAGQPDKIWPDVFKEFSEKIPGYHVRYTLVHAKDYGVPQNRPRILLVGIRKDIEELSETADHTLDEIDAVKCRFLPAPRKNEFPGIEQLLADLLDPSIEENLFNATYARGIFETTKYSSTPANKFQESLREVPPHLVKEGLALTDHQYSKHAHRIVDKFKYMIENNGTIPEEYRTKKFAQKVLPPTWGNGEPTITATSMPDDYVHYCQPRTLTVREWARLQMFPDWYQFAGKRTTGGLRRAGNPREGVFDREVPKYTQIGNAVPVELARRVAVQFNQILDEALGDHR